MTELFAPLKISQETLDDALLSLTLWKVTKSVGKTEYILSFFTLQKNPESSKREAAKRRTHTKRGAHMTGATCDSAVFSSPSSRF